MACSNVSVTGAGYFLDDWGNVCYPCCDCCPRTTCDVRYKWKLRHQAHCPYVVYKWKLDKPSGSSSLVSTSMSSAASI
jgi:hypothetical protein